MLNWFAFFLFVSKFPSFTFKLTQSKRMEFNSYAKSSKMSPGLIWENENLIDSQLVSFHSSHLRFFYSFTHAYLSICRHHSAHSATRMKKNDWNKNFNGEFLTALFSLNGTAYWLKADRIQSKHDVHLMNGNEIENENAFWCCVFDNTIPIQWSCIRWHQFVCVSFSRSNTKWNKGIVNRFTFFKNRNKSAINGISMNVSTINRFYYFFPPNCVIHCWDCIFLKRG